MKKHVKIFWHSNIDGLQKEIDEWMDGAEGNPIQVSISISEDETITNVVAAILYESEME